MNGIQKTISQYLFLFRIYKIGRNQDQCHIFISDGTVSRQHAELEFKDNQVFIKDVGSGIWVCYIKQMELLLMENKFPKTLQLN